jgi:hypothetical protein
VKTKVIIFCSICTIVFQLVLGISPSSAAIPYTINYQGYLTNSTGAPVDGTVSMTFSLYTAAAGGTALWTETQNVDVSGGIYSVILGSLSTLTPLAFDVPYWLGVRMASDAEMTPRVQLTSVGYAFTSDMAMDLVCPGCVNFSDIGQNGCAANQFMMWNGTSWTCSATGFTETDPHVGILNAGGWCISDGTVINCNAAPGAESDPQVGATLLNQWCIGSGLAVDCNQSATALAAAHNHDLAYVNETGDSMTGALAVGINGAGSALTSTNAGTGSGVTGQSTSGFGVQAIGGGDASWTDLVGDLFLGGNRGEIFTNGDVLNLYSNNWVSIDLDNDNNGSGTFEIWDGTDNLVFTVDESGNVSANGNVSAAGTVSGYGVRVREGALKPSCAVAGDAGMLWFTNSAAGIKDTLEVCAKDAANAYAWRTLY